MRAWLEQAVPAPTPGALASHWAAAGRALCTRAPISDCPAPAALQPPPDSHVTSGVGEPSLRSCLCSPHEAAAACGLGAETLNGALIPISLSPPTLPRTLTPPLPRALKIHACGSPLPPAQQSPEIYRHRVLGVQGPGDRQLGPLTPRKCSPSHPQGRAPQGDMGSARGTSCWDPPGFPEVPEPWLCARVLNSL